MNPNRDSAALRHIIWLGGSPCAGKSSIAAALCAENRWRYYKCDDYVNIHLTRSRPQTAPTLHELHALSCDELWMRPLAEQVRTEIAYCVELFSEILTDLRALPVDRPLMAEGAALLPHLVAPLLSAPGASDLAGADAGVSNGSIMRNDRGSTTCSPTAAIPEAHSRTGWRGTRRLHAGLRHRQRSWGWKVWLLMGS
jgi:hypothetical protein